MGTKMLSDFFLLSTFCLFASFFMIKMTSAQSPEADSSKDVGFTQFAESLNDLESKLGKPLYSKDKNSVVCVPSAQIVLGLLYAGAKGKTASELEGLFGVGNDQSNTLSKFKSYVSFLKVPETKIANAEYVASGFTLKKDYVEKGKQYFNVTVSNLDFHNKAAAANTINTWAAKNTDNLITNLLNADDLSDDTKLVLLNAIYFKGQWKYQFDPKKTKDGDFKVSATKTIKVKQMSQRGKFLYAQDEDYQYLSLPYSNEKLSMLVILPKDIETFQKKDLPEKNLSSLKLTNETVEILLPKFTIESTINFAEILKTKIPSAFDASANLKGISDQPLYVSMMKQKAYIKTDEKGTEAAAVTVGGIGPLIARPSFIADHPFYYYIQFKAGSDTSINLFQGIVVEPKA